MVDRWLALAIIIVAFCVGATGGAWIAGPMPTPDRTPEPPERNYTLETLRALNPPPPPPRVEYYRASPDNNFSRRAVIFRTATGNTRAW